MLKSDGNYYIEIYGVCATKLKNYVTGSAVLIELEGKTLLCSIQIRVLEDG